MKYDNYDKTRTETWYKVAPETKGTLCVQWMKRPTWSFRK